MIKKDDTQISTGIILLFVIPLFLSFFLFIMFMWIATNKDLPVLTLTQKDSALRGNIISNDGFILANSQKIYKATIDTRTLNPDKKELFIKLYSIYTNENETNIAKKINKTKGNLVLSYKIDAKTATHLKELARALNGLKVFTPFGKNLYYSGLNIVESGEKRDYILGDILEPVLGYTKKFEQDDITKISGVDGIEKFYDDYLKAYKDEEILGYRDIGFNLIFNKNSKKQKRIDGYDLISSINLKIQKNIEFVLDSYKKKFQAKEIIVGIINPKSGEILSLASSNRFNPENKNLKNLNSTAIKYPYEMGSVIKPIVFANYLELNKLDINETIETYGGVYKLTKTTIRDSHRSNFLKADEILIYSSNVGMAVVSKRLSKKELRDGFLNFGFSQKSGIDMPYEQIGVLPQIRQLNAEKDLSYTLSYGYGISATFMQILRAYTAFNNDGIIKAPKLISYLQRDDKKFILNTGEDKRAISQKTANTIKEILIKVVENGTAKATKIQGLQIGGKTGTAAIAEGKSYIRDGEKVYNSSFFGFASDTNQTYTIGVLVRDPKVGYNGKIYGGYYAAQNAVYVFRDIVNLLCKNGFLIKKQGEILVEKNDDLVNIRD